MADINDLQSSSRPARGGRGGARGGGIGGRGGSSQQRRSELQYESKKETVSSNSLVSTNSMKPVSQKGSPIEKLGYRVLSTYIAQEGEWNTDEVWKSKTLNFVKEIISTYILYDPELQIHKERFFNFIDESPANQIQLYTCFVSKHYDKKYNYEKLEFLGDKVIGASLNKILYIANERFSLGFQPNNFTEYFTKYLSKNELKKVGKVLNLVEYGKFRETINSSLLEDYTEAFIGGLFLTGEAFSPGFGHFICDKFALTISGPGFLDLKFTREEIRNTQNPSQWVSQMIESLPGSKKKEYKNMMKVYTVGNKFYCKFILTGSLLSLIEKNFNVSNLKEKVIVDMSDQLEDTSKIAQMVAAKKVKEWMISIGIDERLKDNIKFGSLVARAVRKGFEHKRKLMAKMKERNVFALEVKDVQEKELAELYEKTYSQKTEQIIEELFSSTPNKENYEVRLLEEYIK